MAKELTPEEVAIMIRARQIQREKGLDKDADISNICESAGVSRKTGYQWAEKHANQSAKREKELEDQLAKLQTEHEQLKKDYDWVSFENDGRKLAWEIHEVDEWLASKKTLQRASKRKSGSFLQNQISALAHGSFGSGDSL